jgi:hypothetical protein
MLLTSSLGFTPTSASIVLSEGADFLFSVNLTGGATFPPGTTAWIAWKNTANSVWNAVVEGGSCIWDIQSAQTTAAIVPNGTKYSLFVSYPDGVQRDDYLWYTGWARRVD